MGRGHQWSLVTADLDAIIDTLKGQLDLERHGGRTIAGVYSRIAQRLLAMAACILARLVPQPDRQTHPDRVRPLTHKESLI
jgi:hypothetical protein